MEMFNLARLGYFRLTIFRNLSKQGVNHSHGTLKRTANAVSLSAIAVISLFALHAPAHAAGQVSVTPGIGTEGLSLKGSYRWSQNIAVTGVISGGSYHWSGLYNGATTTADFSLFNTGLMLDYFPGGGDFRITGGFRYSADKITGTASAGGQTVSYEVKPNKIQPYLGAGYAWNFADSVSLDFDLGAFYTGGYKVKTSAPIISSQLNDAVNKAQTKANNYKFYPVAQVGLRFDF